MFRLAEILDASYRDRMTMHSEVPIAGVPWPVYKLVALAVGFLVLLMVGIATTSAAASVLTAAAVGTLVWVGLGASGSSRS